MGTRTRTFIEASFVLLWYLGIHFQENGYVNCSWRYAVEYYTVLRTTDLIFTRKNDIP